jgi:pilus assembly protein CpaB
MLAAIFGILSAALVFAFLGSNSGSDSFSKGLDPSEGTVSVLVLSKNVQVGERITEEMLTSRSLPRSMVLAGAMSDRTELVGKVATAPLFQGEQVLQPKVTTYEGQNTLAFKVPDGLRAVSVMVPHEAWITGGLIQPGDRIDFLAITTLMQSDPLTGEERLKAGAGIIAENVEVLAVSQSLVKSVPNLDMKNREAAEGGSTEMGAGGFSGDPTKDATSYEKSISVTLAVTPEQAAYIAVVDAMKDDRAQYRLLVRQKGDASKLTGISSWTLSDILGID